jgi:lysozyme
MKKLLLVTLLVLLIMAFIVPVASAAPPASGGYWYHVKYGDTLYGVARYTGVSAQAIINANGIQYPNWIYAGTYLWIPASSCCCCDGPVSGHRYVVKYGDTLLGIAHRYGVDAWSIARANGIYNMNYIYAGQRLYIP